MKLNKLDDTHGDFIRLILRSNNIGDGWIHVHDNHLTWMDAIITSAPELYELKNDGPKEPFYIRLTSVGWTLARYL